MMKFNVSYMNIVIDLGFVSAMNATNYDLWSNIAQAKKLNWL